MEIQPVQLRSSHLWWNQGLDTWIFTLKQRCMRSWCYCRARKSTINWQKYFLTDVKKREFPSSQSIYFVSYTLQSKIKWTGAENPGRLKQNRSSFAGHLKKMFTGMSAYHPLPALSGELICWHPTHHLRANKKGLFVVKCPLWWVEKVPSTQSRELILSLELDLSAHSLLAVTCTSYVFFFSVLKTIFPWIVFLAFFFFFSSFWPCRMSGLTSLSFRGR